MNALTDRQAWLFSIKTYLAAVAALYIAMAGNLSRPYWAMGTVYIVSQPLLGPTRAKGVYRIVGTLVAGLATLLVLPANTSFGDMDEVVRRFGAAYLQGLVLSKLDETGRFGNALSVAVDHALPITWVTDGQDVPEDLHRASAANLVLRLEELRRAADKPCNPEKNQAVA
ncbi:hypothetical protein G6F46_014345 [Rhizopus delemar]|nr:hypothetical protein G6F46_014345 [Rhizopus delemar]